LSSSANQAFAAFKQAEIDEQAADGPLYKASKVISLCCAVLAAIGLMKGGEIINTRPPWNTRDVAPIGRPEQPISDLESPTPKKEPAQPRTPDKPITASAPPIDRRNLEPPVVSDFANPEDGKAPLLPSPQEIPQATPDKKPNSISLRCT
jgi:hypothetical protein